LYFDLFSIFAQNSVAAHTRSQTERSIGINPKNELDQEVNTSSLHSSKNEAESPTQVESAPLTLPMHFYPSESFSYDSSQNSSSLTQHKSTIKSERDVTSSQTTPQKSNISMKRKFQDSKGDEPLIGAKSSVQSDFEKEATSPRCSEFTIPISSLSYNQLQHLHQETNDINNQEQSSVRNAVLSLTLALTSHASAWDSSFLIACNEKVANQKNPVRQGGKWIPRLLEGTEIAVQKKNSS
jgi:hypothetical protein